LRSTPAFFLTHDHDMFENDEFDDRVAVLPPDTYGALGAEQTQRLYYPEFLPDPNRRLHLFFTRLAAQPLLSRMELGKYRGVGPVGRVPVFHRAMIIHPTEVPRNPPAIRSLTK